MSHNDYAMIATTSHEILTSQGNYILSHDDSHLRVVSQDDYAMSPADSCSKITESKIRTRGLNHHDSYDS